MLKNDGEVERRRRTRTRRTMPTRRSRNSRKMWRKRSWRSREDNKRRGENNIIRIGYLIIFIPLSSTFV